MVIRGNFEAKPGFLKPVKISKVQEWILPPVPPRGQFSQLPPRKYSMSQSQLLLPTARPKKSLQPLPLSLLDLNLVQLHL